MAEKKVDWCLSLSRLSFSKIDQLLYICLFLLNYLSCFNGNKLGMLEESIILSEATLIGPCFFALI